jgi:hypothetical protein
VERADSSFVQNTTWQVEDSSMYSNQFSIHCLRHSKAFLNSPHIASGELLGIFYFLWRPHCQGHRLAESKSPQVSQKNVLFFMHRFRSRNCKKWCFAPPPSLLGPSMDQSPSYGLDCKWGWMSENHFIDRGWGWGTWLEASYLLLFLSRSRSSLSGSDLLIVVAACTPAIIAWSHRLIHAPPCSMSIILQLNTNM